MTVDEYIKANWHRAIYKDEPGTGFGGVDLPYRYSSASIKGEGRFYFFFYWDTYFTNLGLLPRGHHEIARENILNMLWLIERQGYMPNHVGLENRSQPPYLCRMIEDYLFVMKERSEIDSSLGSDQRAVAALVAGGAARASSGYSQEQTSGSIEELHQWANEWDSEFYLKCAVGVRSEYHFWQTARRRGVGLNGYGHHDSDRGAAEFYDRILVRRLGVPDDADFSTKARVGGEYLAEAESGWDFTQRFDGRALDHVAVDLNALLYGHERFLSNAAALLGWERSEYYRSASERRRALMQEILWDTNRHWFFDYDCVRGVAGDVISLAGITPLMAGIASGAQAKAMIEVLSQMEREHGLAVAAPRAGAEAFQWAYPNVWPCQVYVAVVGLARYGFLERAARIAQTFLATTDRLYEQTGVLWEKTDAETGAAGGGEYEAVPMLGWTAGVYLALSAFLGSLAADRPDHGG